MDTAQRIRIIRMIEKIEKNPEFSSKIGVRNPQWKNRLAVVRGIVERKNLLGYRMERHEELHACLLSFLADELPTLGVLTDMVRVQFLYIYIG